MGANYRDIRDQLIVYLEPLEHVVGAFLTIAMNPAQVHLWTLLDKRNELTEDRLAHAELLLMSSFQDVSFDFTTVHLQERNALEFIPDGAIPVVLRTRPLLKHFMELYLATHAGA